MTKVFIDGDRGTTGLRIHQRLRSREDITLLSLDEDHRKDEKSIKEMLNRADIAILCLPDDAAREAVAMVENPDVKILDASTAHRTAPGWAYGLPELSLGHRGAIAAGKRIAVPGCYASGVISLCYPLIKEGILPADYPLVTYAISGYSGAGKAGIAAYEAKNRAMEFDAPRQYALTQEHKHLKEITAVCGLDAPPIFAPFVTDFYSGMEVSLPLYGKMLNKKMTVSELKDFYRQYYKESSVINIIEDVEDIAFLPANAYAGRDSLHIFVGGNDDRLLIASLFDNLGKGASGAAVQCLNIALGIDETVGLVL